MPRKICLVITRPLFAMLGGVLFAACDPPTDLEGVDPVVGAAPIVYQDTSVELVTVDAQPEGPEQLATAIDPTRAPSTFATQVSLGTNFTCSRHYGGQVRCWGTGAYGALGTGSSQHLGDQLGELPVAAIDLGGAAAEVGAGWLHACARMSTGNVRCWGYNDYGQLGYGHVNSLGDQPGEMPPPDVDVGAPVKQLAVGISHTCALLQDGHVRCWGDNGSGELGYGHTDTIGDEPGEMPPANVPGISDVIQLVAGDRTTCALIEGGSVRCWGMNAGGVLGLGHSSTIGDDPGEMPPAPVNLGPVPIAAISAGAHHVCARTTGDAIKCWGSNSFGELGYGHTNNIGDGPGEMPPPNVNVGGAVWKLAAHYESTCVGLSNAAVRCWGRGSFGAPGYASTQNVGDGPGEMPPPDVNLGALSIHSLAQGPVAYHACMLDNYFKLRCWGSNFGGKLGYGHINAIGDNEHPVVAGTVPY